MINFRRFLNSIFIVFMLCIFFYANSQNVYSYSMPIDSSCMLDGQFDIIPDNNGNFLVFSCDKNSSKTIASYLDTTSESPALQPLYFKKGKKLYSELPYKYNTVNYNNGSIYISYTDDSTTILENYIISGNNLILANTLSFSGIINSSKQIALCCDNSNNENNFIFTINNTNGIKAFSDYDSFDIISENENFIILSSDISKENIYALTSSGKLVKYNVSSKNYTSSEITLSSSVNTLSEGFKFLTDNMLITASGKIYTLDDNKTILTPLNNSIDISHGLSYISIAGWNNHLILAPYSDNVLCLYNCANSSAIGKVTLEEKIAAISTSGNTTICITKSNETKSIIITTEDNVEKIESIPDNSQTNDNNNDNNNNNNNEHDTEDEHDNVDSALNNNDSNLDDPSDDNITSEVYYIDYENHTISDISSNTTLAELKNALIFNGYNISVKNAKGVHKSGNLTKVGTGDILTFSKDGTTSTSFMLIVDGDLTGSGTITYRDIIYMTYHILNIVPLDGIYLKAADLNKDGYADSLDLMLMYKTMQK